MGLRKYSSLSVIAAQMCQSGTEPLMRTAHRAIFDYTPRPGYLYVRSRAISSRTNDNFDSFPAEEIRKSYKSFIGRPVFVNHKNSNHRRARGAIVDAVLHEDTNPDGSPDVWVEVLHEVDAINFPKLAQAIVKGHVDRTSMGCDVAYSVCSYCGNKAAMPTDYCRHIPSLKGKKIRRVTAGGSSEDVLVSEICYGLNFFENSLLVEEPADPTAYVVDVDTRGLQMAAKKGSSDVLPGEPGTVRPRIGGVADKPTVRPSVPNIESGINRSQRGPSGVDRQRPYVTAMSFGVKSLAKVARKHIAYGETVAPPAIDTLAEDDCPICGANEFNGEECPVCQYVKPPDQYMDPDLEKAQENDLRQDAGEELNATNPMMAPDLQAEGITVPLVCDTCGNEFSGSQEMQSGDTPEFAQAPVEAPAQEQAPPQEVPPPPTMNPANTGPLPENPSSPTLPPPVSQPGGKPDAPKPEETKPQPPSAGKELPKPKDDQDASDDPDAKSSTIVTGPKPSTADHNDSTTPKPDQASDSGNPPSGDTKGMGKAEEGNADDHQHGSTDGSSDADQDSDQGAVKVKEGDTCPACGKGTLKAKTDTQSDTSDTKKDAPPWQKGSDSTKGTKTSSTKPEGLISMAPRPLMKAAQEQQTEIDRLKAQNQWLYRAVTALAKHAGLSVTATEKNPADPVPQPAGSSGLESLDEARQPGLGRVDVSQIGAAPGATDVSADATTKVDTIGGNDANTPYNINEDVTTPVSGTTTGPLGGDGPAVADVRTRPEIQYGDPFKPDAAFPLQGTFADAPKLSSQRTFAALRLARLRMQAGVEQASDDLILAQRIEADASLSDEMIDHEVTMLARVVQQRQASAPARRPVTASQGQTPRAVPSMAPRFASSSDSTSFSDDISIFDA
jgi:hypothetical protein